MLTNFKKHPLPYILALLFVLVEISLGTYVQLGDSNVNIVAYCSVALAFVFVAYCFKKDRLWLFTACAMLLTLCADVFLVLISPYKQLPAMLFFNGAQICYALRLFDKQTKSKRNLHLAVRLALCLVLVVATLLVLKNNTNTVAVISVIYYANLLCNVVYAFITQDTLFAVGLIFFALCDAFVGLGVLCDMLGLPASSILYKLAYPVWFDPVWAFYVPSQTLIGLSVFINKYGH